MLHSLLFVFSRGRIPGSFPFSEEGLTFILTFTGRKNILQ